MLFCPSFREPRPCWMCGVGSASYGRSWASPNAPRTPFRRRAPYSPSCPATTRPRRASTWSTPARCWGRRLRWQGRWSRRVRLWRPRPASSATRCYNGWLRAVRASVAYRRRSQSRLLSKTPPRREWRSSRSRTRRMRVASSRCATRRLRGCATRCDAPTRCIALPVVGWSAARWRRRVPCCARQAKLCRRRASCPNARTG
jgi:hypothetical protein